MLYLHSMGAHEEHTRKRVREAQARARVRVPALEPEGLEELQTPGDLEGVDGG